MGSPDAYLNCAEAYLNAYPFTLGLCPPYGVSLA